MVGMDVEFSKDGASLDPELLQLAEVSPLALKENPHVAEQLYTQWLSLPETVRLVWVLWLLFSHTFCSCHNILS